jgi:DNA-binding transcriptional MerR regulator
MSDTPLYTLRQIASQLDLPESTVRYYRDAFAAHIATVGMGRRRRYPEEAVATLKLIADAYAQGRTRDEIDAQLFGGADAMRARPHTVHADPEPAYNQIPDGEPERPELMWQVVRELARLGETVERTQLMVGELAEQLAQQADRTLPPPRPESAPVPEPPAATPVAAPIDTSGIERQLDELRQELTHERELVERLRKSKLDIERRAAEAEAQLNDEGGSRARSVFNRFRPRPEGEKEGGE